MKHVVQILFAMILSMIVVAPAHARECGGVRLAGQVQVGGSRLTLNGMGIRQATVFNVDVYVAALYLETRARSAQEILQSEQRKRLVLHFVRDVERGDIQTAFREGFQHSRGASAGDIARLNGWVGDMAEGGEMVFTYVPGTGLEVKVNGRVRGTIAGADFARAFLGIWLGTNPPNTGLRSGLLGGRCG